MSSQYPFPMSVRGIVAATGVGVVAAYAALMAVESLVLDPLAAVPGQSLAQIHNYLAHAGMDVAADIWSVLIFSAVGVVLAVVASFVGLHMKVAAPGLAIAFLGILAMGAVVTFGNGFGLGMDVADAYGIGGGDHTIWAGVLYITSLIAAVAIPVVAIAAAKRRTQLRTGLA